MIVMYFLLIGFFATCGLAIATVIAALITAVKELRR